MKVGTILVWLAVCSPAPALADPRFWTHDRAIPSGPQAKSNPDITLLGSSQIFVAWEEATPRRGTDIRMDASFDGGCTWCGTITWASAVGDDRLPRVAVGATSIATLSIQVVFELSGAVYVASDATMNANGSAAELCLAFAALATPAPRLLSPPGSGTCTKPRIVAEPARSGDTHFHATWGCQQPSNSSLHYDHDRTTDATGWGPEYVNLSLTTGESGSDPDITSDSKAAAGSNSAATVFFTGVTGQDIRMIRSTDFGVTWSSPAVVVSGVGAQALPAADSSTSWGSALWNGCVWQSQTSPGALTFDAAQWTAPMTRNPEFEASMLDVAASFPPDTPGSAPALAVGPRNTSNPPWEWAPLYIHWQTASVPAEIVARGGRLDPFSLAQPRDLNQLPFAPKRWAPPDPTVSTVEPFSNCLWSDGWPTMTAASCIVQPRPGGAGAVAVASSDVQTLNALQALFVTVFADDRSGVSQIYFKKTDGAVVSPVLSSVTASCEAIRSAKAELSFPLASECPFVDERIARYLIYYGGVISEGATPSGAWKHRVEIPNIALADPASVTVTGLKENDRYHFVLIAEDEARNVFPVNFDPRRVANELVLEQIAQVVTPACVPVLSMACAIGADSCGGAPSDGAYNPGDTVPVTLTFTNTGTVAATSVTGFVTAVGATVTQPPGGALAIASIAGGGGTATVLARIRLDSTCPPPNPALTVTGLRSDGAAMTYPTLSCGSPLLSVDCRSMCTVTACLVPELSPRDPLLGIRINRDIEWSWPADPAPAVAGYHVNSVLLKSGLVNAHRPPVGTAAPRCDVTASPCTVPGAVDEAVPSAVFYQVLTACGPTGSDEGP